MNDLMSGNFRPSALRSSLRTLFHREWPYLVVLALALFGVAYTTFSPGSMAPYWIALAPLIGVLCVVTRWRSIDDQGERLRLLWTQALHWTAVLVAMHLMFVADVTRVTDVDAQALSALTLLGLGTFTAGVHIRAWRFCLLGLIF